MSSVTENSWEREGNAADTESDCEEISAKQLIACDNIALIA